MFLRLLCVTENGTNTVIQTRIVEVVLDSFLPLILSHILLISKSFVFNPQFVFAIILLQATIFLLPVILIILCGLLSTQ